MIPAAFEYQRPANLEEALRALASGDEGTKIIVGGQSLLPLLKLRVATVERLVDIGRLPELHGIREGADGGVVIGATTTYREVMESPLVAERLPILLEVIDGVGDVQVRNLRSVSGQRAGPADGFFLGAFSTAIRPNEVMLEVRFPPMPEGAGWAWRKLEQPASGYSLVGVAAVVGRTGPIGPRRSRMR
jgi:carbon-monoxide dehydrogenase medium subunit